MLFDSSGALKTGRPFQSALLASIGTCKDKQGATCTKIKRWRLCGPPVNATYLRSMAVASTCLSEDLASSLLSLDGDVGVHCCNHFAE